ncbi:MAG: primosomal protein N' [Lachnospiraceae bacterium]|nr:primosomal protein N' [Lachnospiraceae bacterium]
MDELFAGVIVNISNAQLDRVFQYRVPASLRGILQPGDPVRVPFGAANRVLKGYCIALSAVPEVDPAKIKDLLGIEEKDTSVDGKLIRLAAWMRKNYGGTMLQSLKTVLPVKRKVGQRIERTLERAVSSKEVREAYYEAQRKKQVAKARVLKELFTEEQLPYELVRDRLHVSAPTLKSLERQGLIRIVSQVRMRNPVRYRSEETSFLLTPAQQAVTDTILQDFQEGNPAVYLLHGVTGSGKTAIYIETARKIVALHRQVIILIPEISLTYQTVLRFYREFGERVSVMHSGLSAGERFDQCQRARNGDIDVIIGPRSALFTPFSKIGLIVIDEEHEFSYKSENIPKYHAREAAKELARLHGASLLLGSATPAVESRYYSTIGEYKYFRLTERATGASLPLVHILDMRQELKAGNRSMFSEKLRTLLADRLERGEQSILFLNRRGYAGFISCRSCGYVAKCPHCDVSLSEHRPNRRVESGNAILRCHYCGYEEEKPSLCPECGSKYFTGFRAGTEQVEEEIRKIMPKARTLRMDRDTTAKKDDYEKILSSFANEEADILIGTQMIVKGHDFPKVTLVGILAADMSLNAPDFRAGERTFSLLTQAAGRAGRGSLAGEVIIQTYRPEEDIIRFAAKQDYESFYQKEIAFRSLAGYPPLSGLLCIQITSADAERGKELAGALARQARDAFPGMPVMGPSPGRLSKLKDIYRFAFYIKAEGERMIQAKELIEEAYARYPVKDQLIAFDPNPMQSF